VARVKVSPSVWKTCAQEAESFERRVSPNEGKRVWKGSTRTLCTSFDTLEQQPYPTSKPPKESPVMVSACWASRFPTRAPSYTRRRHDLYPCNLATHTLERSSSTPGPTHSMGRPWGICQRPASPAASPPSSPRHTLMGNHDDKHEPATTPLAAALSSSSSSSTAA
jgi:hypothetical protein